MGCDVVISIALGRQVLAQPLLEPAADPQPLVVRQHHQPVPDLDVLDVGVGKVQVALESDRLAPDQPDETSGRRMDRRTQIVMRLKQIPDRATDLIDFHLDLGPSLKTPPFATTEVGLDDPVGIEPVEDVVVA